MVFSFGRRTRFFLVLSLTSIFILAAFYSPFTPTSAATPQIAPCRATLTPTFVPHPKGNSLTATRTPTTSPTPCSPQPQAGIGPTWTPTFIPGCFGQTFLTEIPGVTCTPTPSYTPIPSDTLTPSNTPTATASDTATDTLTALPQPTDTLTLTVVPTAIDTVTPTPTATVGICTKSLLSAQGINAASCGPCVTLSQSPTPIPTNTAQGAVLFALPLGGGALFTNRKRRRTLITWACLVIAAFGLSACQPAPTPTPIPTSIPSITPSPSLTPTCTPSPTATLTLAPSSTSTSSPTFTPTFPSTPQPGTSAQETYLSQYFGITFHQPSGLSYDYWLENISAWSSSPTRVDVVYQVVTYYDSTIFASLVPPGYYGPGDRFKLVFGQNTLLDYTAQASGNPPNGAAQFTGDTKTQNTIQFYLLTHQSSKPQDVVNPSCGSKYVTANIGILDVTRCTIAHEFGHVLAARGQGGTATQGYYAPVFANGKFVFGNSTPPPCTAPATQFDPGNNVGPAAINSWPWRDHPILSYRLPSGQYTTHLCAVAPSSIVVHEFEADMVMNYVLGFFNQSDAAQKSRFTWTSNQLGQWVQGAIAWTSTP